MRLTYKDQYDSWCSDGSKTTFRLGNPRENYPSLIWGDVVDKLAAYEDTGLEPDEIGRLIATNQTHAKKQAEMWQDLERYLKGEAEGRLLILPCKVEGRLYAVEFGNIREVIVNQFFYDGFSIIVNYYYNHFGHVEGTGIYGKTVFLTREEAEAVLMGGEQHG